MRISDWSSDVCSSDLDLHDLAIEDARNAHQRPKLEAYGDSLFIVVNTAQVIDERISYGETHAFLGARYLATVRHGASLSYAPARAEERRVGNEGGSRCRSRG